MDLDPASRPPSPLPFPPPIGAAPSGDRVLAAAIAMFDELVRRRQHLFPAHVTPSEARAILVSTLRARRAFASAPLEERRARRRIRAAERPAHEALARLQVVVDVNWDHGTPPRRDFFPPGGSPHTLIARLDAMRAGFGRHGRGRLPRDLSRRELARLARAIAAARATASSRTLWLLELEDRTRDLRWRLRALLECTYGPESPELFAYGITPRKPRSKRR
jgi:hypothetical protein